MGERNTEKIYRIRVIYTVRGREEGQLPVFIRRLRKVPPP
jgi:hypothetical protein